jgi:hypothetical protein
VSTRGPRPAVDALEADLARLRADHVLELALDDLDALLCEPDADPFATRRGPNRSGLDDLGLTLSAAERLPDDLTIRILLPADTSPCVSVAHAQAALHRRASDAASAAWRDAMAVRSMGRRQLPIGVPMAVVSAFVAYAAGYFATVVDSTTATGLLVVLAMVAITVAWVVSWMVIESAFLDWRQPARRACAYDLIARSTLEVESEVERVGGER